MFCAPGTRENLLLRRFTAFFSILFMSVTGTRGTAENTRRDLNLLVITIDTLRADRLGSYGNKNIQTPHIDSLAGKGVVFSHAFSHVPLTLPSHCSLFTGSLPIVHGVRDNGYRLPDSAVTLAQIAKKEGYATAAFVGAFPLDSRFGLDRGFDLYDDLYGSRTAVRDLSFVERKAEEVNRKAIEWLTSNPSRSFFVWVHYFDPHAPYEPPPSFARDYAGREYEGEIAYTDGAVGKLLAALDGAGLTGNTLIILTSDHGEGLGEHEEKTHGIFIYDSTLRVPLILAGPKGLPKGRVVEQQVGLIDVMPTILELLGWKAKLDMQGRSLVPLISGSSDGRDEYCYVESLAPLLERNWAPLQGVRTLEWKYIDAPTAELYGLKDDPAEEINVLDKRPDIARRLRESLEAFRKNLSARPTEARIDRDAQSKLRSLGYISGGGARRSAGEKTDRPDPKTMIGLDNLFSDAVIASETGSLERAREMYEEVIRRQPDFLIAYDYASYNLYKMGEISGAILLLKKAVRNAPDDDSLLARLGLYYQEAERLEESLEVLKRAIKINPDYAEAHNYVGVSLYKSGRIEEAIEAFNESIGLDKDYAMAMNNLGNCYLALRQYERSAEEYQKAIALDDHLASAYNGLAAVYYRQDRVEEAIETWEKSLEIDPLQTDALYNLGRVHLRMGRKREALRCFELFLQNANPQKYAKDIEEVKNVVERLKKELGGSEDSYETGYRR